MKSVISSVIIGVTPVGLLSKLWSLFGSLLLYGTYYLGYPKRDHNFDNYPVRVLITQLVSYLLSPLGLQV